MEVQEQLAGLTARHNQLDRLIQEELEHPGTDTLRLTALKREKLRIKDEIAVLQRELLH